MAMRLSDAKRGVHGFLSLRSRALLRFLSEDFSCYMRMSIEFTERNSPTYSLYFGDDIRLFVDLLRAQFLFGPPHIVWAGLAIQREFPVELRPVCRVELRPPLILREAGRSLH